MAKIIGILLVFTCVVLTFIMENNCFKNPDDPEDIDDCMEKNNKTRQMFFEQARLCGLTLDYMHEHYDEWSNRDCKRIRKYGFPECYDHDLNRIYTECAIKVGDSTKKWFNNETKNMMKKFVNYCKHGKPQYNLTEYRLSPQPENAFMVD